MRFDNLDWSEIFLGQFLRFIISLNSEILVRSNFIIKNYEKIISVMRKLMISHKI
jgi:hypothetical protein